MKSPHLDKLKNSSSLFRNDNAGQSVVFFLTIYDYFLGVLFTCLQSRWARQSLLSNYIYEEIRDVLLTKTKSTVDSLPTFLVACSLLLRALLSLLIWRHQLKRHICTACAFGGLQVFTRCSLEIKKCIQYLTLSCFLLIWK